MRREMKSGEEKGNAARENRKKLGMGIRNEKVTRKQVKNRPSKRSEEREDKSNINEESKSKKQKRK